MNNEKKELNNKKSKLEQQCEDLSKQVNDKVKELQYWQERVNGAKSQYDTMLKGINTYSKDYYNVLDKYNEINKKLKDITKKEATQYKGLFESLLYFVKNSLRPKLPKNLKDDVDYILKQDTPEKYGKALDDSNSWPYKPDHFFDDFPLE